MVNGEAVTRFGVKVTPGVDTVSVDGKEVQPARRRWIVFHKPEGLLCTSSDPHGGKTVYHALPSWANTLRYVGRLDRDSSGLLLFTNDGDLAAALAHPRSRIEREYLAQVHGEVTARVLRALKKGVELDDGFAKPKRVRRVQLAQGGWGLRLVLTEGRKREVRRMLKAVGHPVQSLIRVRFGPFSLANLKAGGWRPARAAELREAQAQVNPHRRRKRHA